MDALLNTVLAGIDNEGASTKKKKDEDKPTKSTSQDKVEPHVEKTGDTGESPTENESEKKEKPWLWTPPQNYEPRNNGYGYRQGGYNNNGGSYGGGGYGGGGGGYGGGGYNNGGGGYQSRQYQPYGGYNNNYQRPYGQQYGQYQNRPGGTGAYRTFSNLDGPGRGGGPPGGQGGGGNFQNNYRKY